MFIIVAAHIVFLGGLLLPGCKPDGAAPVVDGTTNRVEALPPISPGPRTVEETSPAPVNAEPPEQEFPVAGSPPPVDPGPVAPAPVPTPAPAPVVKPDPGPLPVDPAPAKPLEHVVKVGETFTSIAQEHGVSVQAIVKVNPAVNPTQMRVGEVILIPPAEPKAPESESEQGVTLYEIQAGDTLSAIARQFKTTVKAIREANELTTSRIDVGQKLRIPSVEESPAAP